MALNFKISNAAAAAALTGSGLASLLNGGTLLILDGTQAATADTAIGAQQTLATLTFSATAFTASNNVATANAITSGTIAITGTASWFRCLTSGGAKVCDGSVGVGTFDLAVPSTAFVAGVVAAISAMTLTLPEA